MYKIQMMNQNLESSSTLSFFGVHYVIGLVITCHQLLRPCRHVARAASPKAMPPTSTSALLCTQHATSTPNALGCAAPWLHRDPQPRTTASAPLCARRAASAPSVLRQALSWPCLDPCSRDAASAPPHARPLQHATAASALACRVLLLLPLLRSVAAANAGKP